MRDDLLHLQQDAHAVSDCFVSTCFVCALAKVACFIACVTTGLHPGLSLSHPINCTMLCSVGFYSPVFVQTVTVRSTGDLGAACYRHFSPTAI